MHLSMLSPRGGRGDPGHMWGIWLFRRIFGQNPHCGAPKLGQIRSNIPMCSFNSYWKWVVRSIVLYKYKNKFLLLLKAAIFQGFTKALKAALLQFQDGRRSGCPFRKRSMPFSRHLGNFLTINKFFSAKLKKRGNYVNNHPVLNPERLLPNIPLIPLHYQVDLPISRKI